VLSTFQLSSQRTSFLNIIRWEINGGRSKLGRPGRWPEFGDQFSDPSVRRRSIAAANELSDHR
jgi:hypothetical protein